MLCDGDIEFKWVGKDLAVIFLNDQTQEEDHYLLDQDSAYALLKFLFKKFKFKFKDELLSKLN